MLRLGRNHRLGWDAERRGPECDGTAAALYGGRKPLFSDSILTNNSAMVEWIRTRNQKRKVKVQARRLLNQGWESSPPEG